MTVMSYGNIPFRMGFERFASRCGESGAGAAIIPDLPWDERLPGLKKRSDAGASTSSVRSHPA